MCEQFNCVPASEEKSVCVWGSQLPSGIVPQLVRAKLVAISIPFLVEYLAVVEGLSTKFQHFESVLILTKAIW